MADPLNPDDTNVFDYLGGRQPLTRPKLSVASAAGGGVTAPVTPGVSGGVGGGGTVTGESTAPSRAAAGLDPIGLSQSALKFAEGTMRLFAPETPAPVFPTPGREFAAEVAAGRTPQTDIFNPNFIGAPPDVGAGLSGAEASLAAGAEHGAVEAGGAALGEVVGTALPYAGAALNIAQVARGDLPDTEKAIDAAINVAGAAAAPFTFGASLAAVPLATQTVHRMMRGDFTDLIPLVGPVRGVESLVADVERLFGPSHYDATRQRAVGEAGRDLGALAGDYAGATGDPASTLKALSQAEGGRGAVRSLVSLPPDIAQTVGVAPGQHEWSDFTPEQFTALVTAARSRDDWSSWFKGSGDVAYLNQSQAQQVADHAANSGRALFEQALAFQPETPAPAEPPTTALTMPGSVQPGGPAGALGFATDLLEST